MKNQRAGQILVVDDSALVRRYLSDVLSYGGHTCVSFTDAASVLRYLTAARAEIALIISDIDMPGMNGMELLKTVRAEMPQIPFILLSGCYEESIALEVLRIGASDYLLKPAAPDEIIRLVNKHLLTDKDEREERVRATLACCVQKMRLSSGDPATHLAPLFDMLGFRRFETLQHSERVAAYSLLIAKAHDVQPEFLSGLELGALLHDIGKAAIPHNVLMKDGPLNEEEWRVIKMHPRIGFELIAAIPGTSAEAEIVYCHHERFNGKGYPRGLAGRNIPLNARIFSIADALDAICSDRAYRTGSTIAKARLEIDRAAGSHFDPELVESFRYVTDADIRDVQARFADEERRYRESLAVLGSTRSAIPGALTIPLETRQSRAPLFVLPR
jgi:response regulator RpfG family c-di-GMP phosphodiesterase